MEIISQAEARARGLKRYCTGKPCKRGHIAERYTSYGACVECAIQSANEQAQDPEQAKKRLRANMTPEQVERARARNRAWNKANPEYWKLWHEKNRDKWNASCARDRSTKLQATPAWTDHSAIAAVYAEAERLTRETGIPHHVDHIVPLRSKLVCGLHVPANLRPLPAGENKSKSNRHWPDMP